MKQKNKREEKDEGEREEEERSRQKREQKEEGRERQGGVCCGMITFVKKLRNRIYGQLTNVAEFFVRVQVVKVAEEPLLTTYATPPDCETKRRRGRKVREREEERNRQRRG